MTLFIYLALVSENQSEKKIVCDELARKGYRYKIVSLGQQFGIQDLYGIDLLPDHLFEVEFDALPRSDGSFFDFATMLLNPQEKNARWQHYRECAQRLGKVVREFHDDREVDQLYLETPLELGVTILLRGLSKVVNGRPLILNIDPDFELRFGKYRSYQGLDSIRQGVWQEFAFTDDDPEKPLRLTLT